jgi:hypothetical protein
MRGTCIATALPTITMAAGTASCSKQTETAPGKQTTCPIMKGKAIDPNLYVDANGKRIYVCCPGCAVQIKADPDKYIKQMEAEGIELETSPDKEAAGSESDPAE